MRNINFKAAFVLISTFICLYLPSTNGKVDSSTVIFKGVKNYCELSCGNNKTHTLCNASDGFVSDNCAATFREYNLDDFKYIKDDLMSGHNGLRNRIARIVPISDMRKLAWDPELSRWASLWIRKCVDYPDPCTNIIIQEGETVGHEIKVVNQLASTMRRKYFPPRLVTSVLRKWYLEKNLMKPPRVIHGFGYFRLSNNFTQLAWASTYRIGCALAKNRDIYKLLCNYFPYKIPGQWQPAFKKGKPVTHCPNPAPLEDVTFDNLCTGNERGHNLKFNYSLILLLLIVIVE